MKKYFLTFTLLLIPILVLFSAPTQAEAAVDLYIPATTIFSVSPTSVAVGGNIKLSDYRITNGGSNGSASFYVGYYLSNSTAHGTDGVIDSFDIKIGEASMTGISALSFRDITGPTITIPAGTLGGYVVNIFVDSTKTVAESNENNNNNKYTGLTVTQPPPTYIINGSLGVTADAVSISGGGSCSGNYSCTGIPSGSNVTITPTKTGGTFNPTSRTHTNVTADIVGQDFAFTSTPICSSNWSCGAWGTCSGGTQTRTCTDSNSCNPPNPANTLPTSQSCGVTTITTIAASKSNEIFQLFAGPGIFLDAITPGVDMSRITVGIDERALLTGCGDSNTGKVYWTGTSFACGNDAGGGGGGTGTVTQIDAGEGLVVWGAGAPGSGNYFGGNIKTSGKLSLRTDCAVGQVLKRTGPVGATSGGWGCADDVTGGTGTGDNLGVVGATGSHTAGQNIKLGNYYLSGDGGDEGIKVSSIGDVETTKGLIVNGGNMNVIIPNGNFLRLDTAQTIVVGQILTASAATGAALWQDPPRMSTNRDVCSSGATGSWFGSGTTVCELGQWGICSPNSSGCDILFPLDPRVTGNTDSEKAASALQREANNHLNGTIWVGNKWWYASTNSTCKFSCSNLGYADPTIP